MKKAIKMTFIQLENEGYGTISVVVPVPVLYDENDVEIHNQLLEDMLFYTRKLAKIEVIDADETLLDGKTMYAQFHEGREHMMKTLEGVHLPTEAEVETLKNSVEIKQKNGRIFLNEIEVEQIKKGI